LPDGGAVLDLDFANGQASENGSASTFASLLTVSNATGGYAETSSGTWQLFAANTPRITDKGLLAEHAKTNAVLWDCDLTQPVWQATNVAASPGGAGIDGVTTGTALTALADNGTIVQLVKDGSRARVVTAFVERISGSGTVAMTMDGVTWTTVPVTGTWARVQIPTQTLANPTIGFQLGTAGDQIAVQFVQSENTALFASSPIYTTTAAVTRAADVITLTDPTVTDTALGTWFADLGEQPGGAAGGTRMVAAMRSDAADKIIVGLLNDNHLVGESLVANVVTAVESGDTVPTADGNHRIAFAYQASDLAAAFSADLGGNLVTSTSSNVPTGNGDVSIGNNEGAQQLDGYIRHVEWLHSRVTNAGLQAWVSP
jgi:hypothetical protein